MLENDGGGPQQTSILPHNMPTSHTESILAGEDLHRRSTEELQARRHGHYYYKKAMEMDWACTPERFTVNSKNSDALDPVWQEEEGKTKDDMEKNSGK